MFIRVHECVRIFTIPLSLSFIYNNGWLLLTNVGGKVMALARVLSDNGSNRAHHCVPGGGGNPISTLTGG